MTKRMNEEERAEARQRQRLRADDKWLARQDAEDARKERAIRNLGQLCREGKTIYYVFPVGGTYRESADPYDLV